MIGSGFSCTYSPALLLLECLPYCKSHPDVQVSAFTIQSSLSFAAKIEQKSKQKIVICIIPRFSEYVEQNDLVGLANLSPGV